MAGEISYEIFLVHLVLMEVAMVCVLRAPVYTGSMLGLFVVTMVITVPVSWLLHRLTRVRSRVAPTFSPSRPSAEREVAFTLTGRT